eukprot:1284895-Prymnesium_polylepis.1
MDHAISMDHAMLATSIRLRVQLSLTLPAPAPQSAETLGGHGLTLAENGVRWTRATAWDDGLRSTVLSRTYS